MRQMQLLVDSPQNFFKELSASANSAKVLKQSSRNLNLHSHAQPLITERLGRYLFPVPLVALLGFSRVWRLLHFFQGLAQGSEGNI